jgi:hypothetical protein
MPYIEEIQSLEGYGKDYGRIAYVHFRAHVAGRPELPDWEALPEGHRNAWTGLALLLFREASTAVEDVKKRQREAEEEASRAAAAEEEANRLAAEAEAEAERQAAATLAAGDPYDGDGHRLSVTLSPDGETAATIDGNPVDEPAAAPARHRKKKKRGLAPALPAALPSPLLPSGIDPGLRDVFLDPIVLRSAGGRTPVGVPLGALRVAVDHPLDLPVRREDDEQARRHRPRRRSRRPRRPCPCGGRGRRGIRRRGRPRRSSSV